MDDYPFEEEYQCYLEDEWDKEWNEYLESLSAEEEWDAKLDDPLSLEGLYLDTEFNC